MGPVVRVMVSLSLSLSLSLVSSGAVELEAEVVVEPEPAAPVASPLTLPVSAVIVELASLSLDEPDAVAGESFAPPCPLHAVSAHEQSAANIAAHAANPARPGE